MKIYHPTKGSREIPAIDFTDLWRKQGWQAEPFSGDHTAPANPAPKLLEPPPTEPALHDPVAVRIAELEALEKEKGWDAIRDIADSFDPPVPKGDTWVKTIPAIVAREQADGKL
ncbi:MAG: hypothetical protein F6K00_19595 [Leptolyngbya sp. SIOISBB]|nr:hypothetical protein [Leptolyngbya sp. SIOISBB]